MIEAGALVVVSPHLDDAVFSCGSLMAAAALFTKVYAVTVFAGVPDEQLGVTQLDAAAGFASSVEAVAARRLEDRAACELLGAEAVHLELLDGQYHTGADCTCTDDEARVASIEQALEAFLGPLTSVVAPVGLRHRDHRLVALACAGLRVAAWYEELPYRVLWPEVTPMIEVVDVPVLEVPASTRKGQAMTCYRSQIGDAPIGPELFHDERYYRR